MRSIFIYCVTFVAAILVFSCTGMNSQVKLEKSGIQYWRPQSSNGSVAGKKVAYQLWFDKNKWRVLDHEDSTYKFMEEADYFTLSFFEEKDRDVLKFCGSHSGRDTNKIAKTGITPIEGESGTVYFSEARLVLEFLRGPVTVI